MKWLFNKIAGSKNRRELNKLEAIVKKINDLDEEFQSLTDEQLKQKTSEWKNKIKSALPKMFSRSGLLGKNNSRPHLGPFRVNFPMDQTNA